MGDLAEALQSAHDCMVFDSRDWAAGSRDAWLYGLFVGWDEPDDGLGHEPGDMDDDVLAELIAKHGWSQENVDRLQRLRAAIRHAGAAP